MPKLLICPKKGFFGQFHLTGFSKIFVFYHAAKFVFWDDVKIPLLASTNDAFIKEELSTSQKQVAIKLI